MTAYVSDERSAPTAPCQPASVAVSPRASQYLRERGGSLYLWLEPFGAWVRDKMAMHSPAGDLDFVRVTIGEAQVFVQQSLGLPDELRIECRRFPRKGLRVYWNRARWGNRGPTIDKL